MIVRLWPVANRPDLHQALGGPDQGHVSWRPSWTHFRAGSSGRAAAAAKAGSPHRHQKLCMTPTLRMDVSLPAGAVPPTTMVLFRYSSGSAGLTASSESSYASCT